MDPGLFFKVAPPLDPDWLEFERTSTFSGPQPVHAGPEARRNAYRELCRGLNAEMLAGRDKYLTDGIEVVDSSIAASDGHLLPVRTYTPAAASSTQDLVIYYHGGGLVVGDLDSEDLSCRRICKDGNVSVISIEYRLLPETASAVVAQDAYDAFLHIASTHSPRRLVLVGSSSGGQLAAQVSQRARDAGFDGKQIDGVLLRCPVTCDPTHGGVYIPERFRSMHTSFSSTFETCLIKLPSAEPAEKQLNLPLEAATFKGLPRTFIQISTNDIFYSDGLCYASALRDAGVAVRLDVLVGWPHTFGLKAPQLDKALEADMAVVQGLMWLLE